MILFPAIDLKDGVCVRLEQGDMARATVFHRDPAAQAQAFEAQGFEYLHIVDLNGAFAGKPVNIAAIERIIEVTSIPLQLGGGIRDIATIEAWLGKGVDRVIIGTAAVRDPDLVKGAARRFPGRIAVGLDARRQGRGRGLGRDLRALRARHRQALRGCRRGGADLHRHFPRRPAQGPQSRRHDRARRAREHPVIASGGLASLADVRALLEPRSARLAGAIAGRALYDGRLDAAEALALIRSARTAEPIR